MLIHSNLRSELAREACTVFAVSDGVVEAPENPAKRELEIIAVVEGFHILKVHI